MRLCASGKLEVCLLENPKLENPKLENLTRNVELDLFWLESNYFLKSVWK